MRTIFHYRIHKKICISYFGIFQRIGNILENVNLQRKNYVSFVIVILHTYFGFNIPFIYFYKFTLPIHLYFKIVSQLYDFVHNHHQKCNAVAYIGVANISN